MTQTDKRGTTFTAPLQAGARVRVRFVLGNPEPGRIERTYMEIPGPLFRRGTPAAYDVRMDDGEFLRKIAASQVEPLDVS